MAQHRLVVFANTNGRDVIHRVMGTSQEGGTDFLTGESDFVWTFSRKDRMRTAVKRIRRLQKNREKLNISYFTEKVSNPTTL